MEIPRVYSYQNGKEVPFMEIESISFSSDGAFGGHEGSIIMETLERKLEVIVEWISVNWFVIKPWRVSKLYIRQLPSSYGEEIVEVATSRDGNYFSHLRLTKRGDSFSFPIGFCGNIKLNHPKPKLNHFWKEEMLRKGFKEKKEIWITSREDVCPEIINVLDRLLHVHVEYSKDDEEGRAMYCITPLHPDNLYYKIEGAGKKITLATSSVSQVELYKAANGFCLCIENNIELDLF